MPALWIFSHCRETSKKKTNKNKVKFIYFHVCFDGNLVGRKCFLIAFAAQGCSNGRFVVAATAAAIAAARRPSRLFATVAVCAAAVPNDRIDIECVSKLHGMNRQFSHRAIGLPADGRAVDGMICKNTKWQ